MSSKDLDLTGVGKVPEEKGKAQKKKVTTVRFEEGVAEHVSAKERGDRSRYYFKDGSECGVCLCVRANVPSDCNTNLSVQNRTSTHQAS